MFFKYVVQLNKERRAFLSFAVVQLRRITMGISENLKKGTSEMLILFLLEKEDMYGYQLAQELRDRSEGYFVMPEGSLYPTLYRLIEKGVVSDRQEIVGKRLRKYYHLEEEGKEYLKSIVDEYRSINIGIQKVLGEDLLKDLNV